MSPAEARAFNAGIVAVLDIAARSAVAISTTTRRRVHEDFAVAALGELAIAGRVLLIPFGPPAATNPPPKSPTPATNAVEAYVAEAVR